MSSFLYSQLYNKDSLSAATSLNLIGEKLIYKNYNHNLCYGTGDYLEGVNENDLLFIKAIYKCEDSYSDKFQYYLDVYFGKESGYLEVNPDGLLFFNKEKIKVSDFYFKFKTMTEEDREALKERSHLLTMQYSKNKIKNLLGYLAEYEKYGIALIKANAYDDYSMTGASFKILNTSKKTIKYITFNFYGKNAVKDKVGNNLTRKGIGPVESYSYGSWDFDHVWLTDIVEFLKINNIQIQYMDGKIKTIPYSDNLWGDEDKFFELENALKE